MNGFLYYRWPKPIALDEEGDESEEEDTQNFVCLQVLY